MGIEGMILSMKKHPDYIKMGMIASHLGVVRGFSLNGEKVTEIDVSFDEKVVDNIINDIKGMVGIVDVMVETYGGRLKVGDDVMAVVVGGDTREHVFPALVEAVDRMKKEGSKKREFF